MQREESGKACGDREGDRKLAEGRSHRTTTQGDYSGEDSASRVFSVFMVVDVVLVTRSSEQQQAAVLGDEGVQTLHLQRPTALPEHVAHELSMHVADEILILGELSPIAAGDEVDPQRILIDDGIKAHVVEVLIQHVDLAQRVGVESRRAGGRRRAVHPASRHRAFDTRSGHGAR